MGCKLFVSSNVRSSDAVIQISPFHTYFVAHIPKLLLSSTFLVILGFLVDNRLNALVYQALSFVICLSFLGHKEWRFIIYVIPWLNVAAARGARALSVSPSFSPVTPDVLFCVQRLTTQGDAIWETLFRSVCWDVICESGVHSGIHLRFHGKLPGRCFYRQIQPLLQNRQQRCALPSPNLSHSLSVLQCTFIYRTWQHKRAPVYSSRRTPRRTTLPSPPRLRGWIGPTIRPRASRPTPHLSLHTLSRRRRGPFLGDGRKWNV